MKLSKYDLTIVKCLMLFSAVPFQMVMYYSFKNEYSLKQLEDKNPNLALGLLTVSVLLWLILFIRFIYTQIIMLYVVKNNLEKIKTSGILREAKIIYAKKISSINSSLPKYELELSFKNLSNSEIREKTKIVDSKPNERRYETGKNINILMDRDLKHEPYFAFQNSDPTVNNLALIIRIVGLLVLIAAVICYYIYAYQTESNGKGWLFMSYHHPLITCPVAILSFDFGFKFLVESSSLYIKNAMLLKYKGLKTTAKILSANKTGSYIDHEPVVAYEIQYTDERNQVHQNTIKKIANLLNTNTANPGYEEIHYLPENPNTVAFASDL